MYFKEKLDYRKIPKIPAPGLYFSKDFFEGFIYGEAYYRRDISVSKSARLKIGGNLQLINVQIMILGVK